MSSHFDTIVAPITAAGAAAVGVVRLSGPEAWLVASRVFSPWRPDPMRAIYGRYRHGDDGIALPFAKGHSYTGEESAELSIHGSPASMRALMAACMAAGARMAEPGEFTLRAFLNGRIDLTQAEAVRDAVEARTEAQLRLAHLQREGALRRRISQLRSDLGSVLARIEATVDFSEEIGELDTDATASDLAQIGVRIEDLLRTASVREVLRRGLRVAIVGPPNAGKSSLLNAVLGRDRAIVTDVPGTTRDFVEEEIEVDGVPVVIIDTAGLRESFDPVEGLGIRRTWAVASGADHLWYVFDARVGSVRIEDTLVDAGGRGPSITLVANKSDLAKAELGIAVSALTGQGIRDLLDALPMERDIAHRELAINPRHREALSEAAEAVDRAGQTLIAQRPFDLASVFLQDAMQALGTITGETASPDMVARIFSDFCIGK